MCLDTPMPHHGGAAERERERTMSISTRMAIHTRHDTQVSAKVCHVGRDWLTREPRYALSVRLGEGDVDIFASEDLLRRIASAVAAALADLPAEWDWSDNAIASGKEVEEMLS